MQNDQTKVEFNSCLCISILTISWLIDQDKIYLKMHSLPLPSQCLKTQWLLLSFVENWVLIKSSPHCTWEYECKYWSMLELAPVFLTKKSVSVVQLSGVTSNTPTHTFYWLHQSFLPKMSAAHQHPSVWDFSLTLWCHMTEPAKCQFVFCSWFDIFAVSLQADLWHPRH